MICKNSDVKTSVIMIARGNGKGSEDNGLHRIIKLLKVMNKWPSVEAVFLDSSRAGFDNVVTKVVGEGSTRIVIFPLFLFSDNLEDKNIHCEIDKERGKHPDVDFFYAGNLGTDERIAQIATDKINAVLRGQDNKSDTPYISNPDAIADESFNTIDKLLEIIGVEDIPEINLPVIKRIIHTTGDPEYGRNFVFSEGAVKAGIDALLNGKCIVTDVNMVKVGINKRLTGKFGNSVECKIAESAIAAKATETGLTRAITAINESVPEIEGGIVAIGNAPSALFHVIDLIKRGEVNPALIVGVPVGFVGAAESKDDLMKLNGVPYITNIGRKGGSPIAVTIVNAILTMANE